MSSNNIKELEKIVNSELASKIQKSIIAFDELLIETTVDELINTIQWIFLFYLKIEKTQL